MAVLIGSARSDERGKITGGKAGDQKSGKEVSTQDWYRHKQGWRTFRAKDPAKAKKMADAMVWFCGSPLIGYDQNQRNSLYSKLELVKWEYTRLTLAVETDCSALIRVCAACAGIFLPDFNTSTQAKTMLASGAFIELKGSKYNNQSTYLGTGDVQVTCSKGHTIMVLSNGSKYDGDVIETEFVDDELGDRILKEGKTGEDVRLMQKYLIDLGYDLGKYGADGDFGECTELAVMAFQKDHGCKPVDGEYGPITHEALMKALDEFDKLNDGKVVSIEGGQCWIRTAPNSSGKKLAVAKRGTVWPYGGMIADNGWLMIEYENQNAWVTDEYGVLKEA